MLSTLGLASNDNPRGTPVLKFYVCSCRSSKWKVGHPRCPPLSLLRASGRTKNKKGPFGKELESGTEDPQTDVGKSNGSAALTSPCPPVLKLYFCSCRSCKWKVGHPRCFPLSMLRAGGRKNKNGSLGKEQERCFISGIPLFVCPTLPATGNVFFETQCCWDSDGSIVISETCWLDPFLILLFACPTSPTAGGEYF